jgi:hypothetical protein
LLFGNNAKEDTLMVHAIAAKHPSALHMTEITKLLKNKFFEGSIFHGTPLSTRQQLADRSYHS